MPPALSFDYQLENFDPSPDEELICSICRCVFFDPVECPCRHVFCKKCITQWLTHHKSCPACRKRISRSSLQEVVPIIRNMIMKLTLLCRNSEKGCEAKCTVELYESHLKTCGFEMVHCKNGSCGAAVMRMNKEKHEERECLFRSATCEICKLNIVFSALPNHDCICDLQRVIQEKDAHIAELLKETDKLRQEIENHKMEGEKSKTSIHISSDDGGDISSVTSISVSSSTFEDSDLDDYNVRIFSVVHPTDSFSMPASVVNESQNIDPSVEDISRTEDFLPLDSTNNYSDSPPKSSSSDYLDSDHFSPIQAFDSRGVAEQSFNDNSFRVESLLQSARRSLKRIHDSTENTGSLYQSTRSSSPHSPLYNDFWDLRRSRVYSEPETPLTSLASANASSNQNYVTYQNQDKQSVKVVNETIEILESSAEDANSSNLYVNGHSSSYVSESSQSSNPHLSASASGRNIRCFQERCRSRLLKQRGFKGLRGKTHLVDGKNYGSSAPQSRIPLPVGNPGSSSTPAFSDNNMSYNSVCIGSSSEASAERGSNHATFSPGLKKTLSLLSKYADKESDPDWVPYSDGRAGSDVSSGTTSSSKEKSSGLREDLSYFSPSCEQGRENVSSESSSSNSESWETEISETDSSYEVEVPPTAWELMQRYCNDADSEDDSEWYPASAYNAQ